MKPTKFIVEVFINDKASIRIENVEWPEAGEESLLSRLSKHPGVVESLNDRIARETRMSFPVPGIVHLEIETTDYIPPPEPPCYANRAPTDWLSVLQQKQSLFVHLLSRAYQHSIEQLHHHS